MSFARNVAAGVGISIGVIALGFGLFADTSVLNNNAQPAANAAEPASVMRQEAAMATVPTGSVAVAIPYQPPAGAVIDREIDFGTPFVEQSIAEPMLLSASSSEPPVMFQPAQPSVGRTPATAGPPSTSPPSISWSTPAKPGEPMLDPNPVD